MPISSTDAMQEALADSPADTIIYKTLEIYNPHITLGPLRFVKNTSDITARLEDSAPRNAGELVLFKGYSWDISLPPRSRSLPEQLSITIDNVPGLLNVIRFLTYKNVETQIIYRKFLSTDLDTPQHQYPLTLSVKNVVENDTSVRIYVGYKDLYNKNIPSLYYTEKRFPFLRHY